MLISILAQSEGGKRLLLNRTVKVADICPLIRKIVSDVPTPSILKADKPLKMYQSLCMKISFDPDYDRGFACHIAGVINGSYPGGVALDTGSWYSLVSLTTWTQCLLQSEDDLLPSRLELETMNSRDVKCLGFGTI